MAVITFRNAAGVAQYDRDDAWIADGSKVFHNRGHSNVIGEDLLQIGFPSTKYNEDKYLDLYIAASDEPVIP